MTSLALAAAVALLLAAWTSVLRHRRVAPWARLAASLAPPLAFTLVIVLSAGRFGDLRVALEGVSFELGDEALEAVRVGGSPEEDHLVVRDLPPGFLTFEPADGGARAVLSPAEPPRLGEEGQQRPAVVRVGEDDAPFHNTLPLEDGLELTLAGGRRLTFDDGRFVSPDGETGPELPGRRDELGLPILRHLPPELEVWPLGVYGVPEGEGPAATGAFVYRAGAFNRKPFLALTEPGVEAGDGAFVPEVALLADGGRERFALYRVDLEPAVPAAGEGSAGRSRTQERRSFTARLRGSRLTLLLDTPFHVRLSGRALERLAEEARGGRPLWTVTVAGDDPAMATGGGTMVLGLPMLGAPMAAELFGRLQPEEDGLRVVTHRGARFYRWGEGFEVGERAAALLRVSRLGVPWGAVAALWAAALAALAAGWTLRREPLPLVLLTAVELFLAWRLLLGYQGAFLDPRVAEAAWRSLAAWAWVPFVLQALVLVYRGRPALSGTGARLAAHGAVAAGVVGLVLWRVPAGWAAAAAALLLPPLLAVGAGLLLRHLDRRLDRLPGWNPAAESVPDRTAWKWLAILAGGYVVLRLVLLVGFGWKEGLQLGGQRLAASIFTLPLVLAVFALLWGWRRRRWAPFALGALLVLLFALVPLLIHDWGTALIFSLPPVLLFAAAALDRRAPLPWRLAHAAPLAAAVVLHAVLVPVVGARIGADWSRAEVRQAEQSGEAAQELLGRRTDLSSDSLRLWSLAAPEALQQVGTTRSEGLAIVMEHLAAYATRGVLGEGYLSVPVAQPLAATHLDDNLSAVHVLGAFGWLGALALLLPLLGLAAAPVRLSRGVDDLPPRQAFGWLAVWTLAVAGLYMVSANVQLLLFTGKNVYFLAAASLSDVVEGAVLAGLALWALAGRGGEGGEGGGVDGVDEVDGVDRGGL